MWGCCCPSRTRSVLLGEDACRSQTERPMVAPTGKSPGETKAGRSEHRSVHTTQHAGVTRPVWESPRLGGRECDYCDPHGKMAGRPG